MLSVLTAVRAPRCVCIRQLAGQAAEVECDAALRGPLLNLHWANLLDQAYEESHFWDAHAAACLLVRYNVCALLRLFAPGAQAWWREHLRTFKAAGAARPRWRDLFGREKRWLDNEPPWWRRKPSGERRALRARLIRDVRAFEARFAQLCEYCDGGGSLPAAAKSA